jgi:predicted amidohydrolase
MRRVIRVAAVQAPAIIGNVKTNAATVETLLAKANGAKLALLPEAYLQGYSYDAPKEVWPLADRILSDTPGPAEAPAAAELCRLAQQFSMYIGTTLMERTPDNDILNSFLIATPEGKLHPVRQVGNQLKTCNYWSLMPEWPFLSQPKFYPANFETYGKAMARWC